MIIILRQKEIFCYKILWQTEMKRIQEIYIGVMMKGNTIIFWNAYCATITINYTIT